MKNDITIGCGIEALQYAHQNNTKLILNQVKFPEKFEPDYVKEAWGLLYTKLMLDGQIIGGDTVKNIRITEDIIQVVCEYNIINEIEYEKINVFDDNNIIDLPEILKQVDEYKVIDVLTPVSLMSPPINTVIQTEDDLVKELYVSKKTNSSTIELFAVSTLTKEKLTDFEYSDTMVKFKSEELLKENNFLGRFRKSDTDRTPIELQVVERLVQKKMDIYKDTDKIKFFYERNQYEY